MCAICGGEVVPNVPIVLCRDEDSKMVCISCAEKESPELGYSVHLFYRAINYQTKEKLLAHYSKKRPSQFIQFDGFDDQRPDDYTSVDKDGHSLSSNITWELMRGSTVRVLVKPGISKETVISLLAKIIRWIDSAFQDYLLQELKTAVDSDNEDTPFLRQDLRSKRKDLDDDSDLPF
jgi:hypothetical protein